MALRAAMGTSAGARVREGAGKVAAGASGRAEALEAGEEVGLLAVRREGAVAGVVSAAVGVALRVARRARVWAGSLAAGVATALRVARRGGVADAADAAGTAGRAGAAASVEVARREERVTGGAMPEVLAIGRRHGIW